MSEITKGLPKMVFGWGKSKAQVSVFSDFIGVACTILGIVGDACNRVLGLEPTNWFLLGLAFFISGFWKWFMAYTVVKKE